MKHEKERGQWEKKHGSQYFLYFFFHHFLRFIFHLFFRELFSWLKRVYVQFFDAGMPDQ